MTNPLISEILLFLQYALVKLGRKLSTFTSHHILKISLCSYHFKKLKALHTISDKGEKCDSMHHAGTEILQLICGRRSRYQEPLGNVDNIRQTTVLALMYWFECLACLKWHLHQCVTWLWQNCERKNLCWRLSVDVKNNELQLRNGSSQQKNGIFLILMFH